MFSEVLPSVRELRSRFQGSGESVTASEVSELKATVVALRKRHRQILGDENASCSEACDLVADAMQFLRNELESKRSERDGLRGVMDEVKGELDRVENDYASERELRESCRDDVVRMTQETEKARRDIINLRVEMKQKTFFQETVDTETKHRLRADLQNLETERERSAIKLRNLRKEREQWKSKFEQLQAERDAYQLAAGERKQELSETKMTKDMYSAHQEALSLHLELLGGDPTNNILSAFTPDNISNSFKGWLMGHRSRESDRSKEGSVKAASQHHGPPRKYYREKQDEKSIVDHFFAISPQGEGVALGANTDGSSNFLRKVPTIFQLGSGNGENDQERDPKLIEELRYSVKSQSSDISALTGDDYSGTESESE